MPENQICAAAPPLLTEAQLHPYQTFCVGFIETHAACGIFLDMGLGKTSIALTAIEHLLFDSYEVSRTAYHCTPESRPRYMAQRACPSGHT